MGRNETRAGQICPGGRASQCSVRLASFSPWTTVAAREAHEKMGFHAGWGIATDQPEALAQKR